MRAILLLTALSLLATTITIATPAHATAVCSDLVTSTCRALVCGPDGNGGQLCSRDLSPVCIKDDCPGLP